MPGRPSQCPALPSCATPPPERRASAAWANTGSSSIEAYCKARRTTRDLPPAPHPPGAGPCGGQVRQLGQLHPGPLFGQRCADQKPRPRIRLARSFRYWTALSVSTGGWVSGIATTWVKPPQAAAARPCPGSPAPRARARPSGRGGRQSRQGQPILRSDLHGGGVGETLAHPARCAPRRSRGPLRPKTRSPCQTATPLTSTLQLTRVPSRHKVEQGHADGDAVGHLLPHCRAGLRPRPARSPRPGWRAPGASPGRPPWLLASRSRVRP